MQRLEVSGAVRPIYGSLGVKRLNFNYRITNWQCECLRFFFFVSGIENSPFLDGNIYIQSGPKKCIDSLLIKIFGINLNEISISVCIHLRTSAPAKSACAICWENIILHCHPELEISFKFIPKILMSKKCIHFFGPLCIYWKRPGLTSFLPFSQARHYYHIQTMHHLGHPATATVVLGDTIKMILCVLECVCVCVCEP